MSELKLIVPMYVEVPRKTKKNVNVWLNMNRFMNLHHIMKNNAKKVFFEVMRDQLEGVKICLLYTSPSPRDRQKSRMPSSA